MAHMFVDLMKKLNLHSPHDSTQQGGEHSLDLTSSLIEEDFGTGQGGLGNGIGSTATSASSTQVELSKAPTTTAETTPDVQFDVDEDPNGHSRFDTQPTQPSQPTTNDANSANSTEVMEVGVPSRIAQILDNGRRFEEVRGELEKSGVDFDEWNSHRQDLVSLPSSNFNPESVNPGAGLQISAPQKQDDGTYKVGDIVYEGEAAAELAQSFAPKDQMAWASSRKERQIKRAKSKWTQMTQMNKMKRMLEKADMMGLVQMPTLQQISNDESYRPGLQLEGGGPVSAPHTMLTFN